MNGGFLLRCSIAAVFLTLTSLVLAQTPPSVAPAKTLPEEPPKVVEQGTTAPPAGGLKDPTKPSPKMKEVLGSKGTAGPAPKLAVLALRGRVLARDKPAVALLEVEGKLYTVTKGSVVAGPSNTILRVVEVNGTEVRIEVSPLKEIVVLR